MNKPRAPWCGGAYAPHVIFYLPPSQRRPGPPLVVSLSSKRTPIFIRWPSRLSFSVLQMRIHFSILALLLTGCSEPYLTSEVEEGIRKVMPDNGEFAIAQLHSNFALLELDPLPEVSDVFALRVIESGGWGNLSSTEITLHKDGFALVTYRREKNDAIGVERVEKLVPLMFRTLKERRGRFDDVWSWSVFEGGKEDVIIHDGSSWIVEIAEAGRRHMVIRSSASLSIEPVDEEFKILIDALKPYEK